MEVTYELIFMVVTATITGILGCVTKDRVIPSRFIPLQNIGIIVIDEEHDVGVERMASKTAPDVHLEAVEEAEDQSTEPY